MKNFSFKKNPIVGGILKSLCTLGLGGMMLCSPVFAQKNEARSPKIDLDLVDKFVKTKINRQVRNGEEFLQRDMTDYLMGNGFMNKENYRQEDDHGHDHKEELLLEYLNRPQPSVATYQKYFKDASQEFNVPVELLMAIGQVQSNWAQVSESMYGSWGVMGLIENKLVQQIGEASKLLKVSPQLIKDDAKTNIRAAAALLAKYQKNEKAATLEDWFEATKTFTGLQDEYLREQLAERFYGVIKNGVETVTLWREKIVLEKHEIDVKSQLKAKVPNTGGRVEAADYPSAVLNTTTCNFNSRNGNPIEYYFVHYIATGTYEGAINWFKNCSAQASTHYIIKNSNGEVTQVVMEADRAWSQGVSFYNDRGVATEHEVLSTNLAMWYSDPMLTSAGALANNVATRRNIPKQRAVAAPGINGHNDVKSTSCPNMTQEVWDLFFQKFYAAGNGGGNTVVAQPTLYTVSNPSTGTGVSATWKANTESNLVGYRLYYATNDALTAWALAADETTLGAGATSVNIASSSNFVVPPSGAVAHFRLTAVIDNSGTKIESGASDTYSRSSSPSGQKVLVVDGFDRTSGSYTASRHSFATNYFKALRDSRSLNISTAANERVADGSVVLSNYNLVVWFLGDESTSEETFATGEQTKVQSYLQGGGNLVVSGSEVAWDLDFKGTTADQTFFNNYLKANYVGDGASGYSPATGQSTAFTGLSMAFGSTYTVPYPDDITTFGGSTSIFNYAVSGKKGGTAFKGTFTGGTAAGGVVYVSFPLETSSLANHTSFNTKVLDYLGIGVTVAAPTANNDAATTQENTGIIINILANDVATGSTLTASSVAIVSNPANGTLSVNSTTGAVTYTPNAGFYGTNTFTYTVKNANNQTSNVATVSITVTQATVCLSSGTEVTTSYPKRDLRGAWISTVSNIDWPVRTQTPAQQQADLISKLDALKAAGINSVFFQVRPECDALYASTVDPWSYYLTGTQGVAPSPIWDPLSFAVTEAHNRGMELHAWLNPYRAKQGTPTLASTHVVNQHPSWAFVAGTKTILDPGIPEVRSYLLSVINDIATRYDVDGIHFDDYFYPYSDMASQDANTFANYNPNGLSLADWRRDNVNKMVSSVYNKIQDVNAAQNKNIVFGISPFGIWKSGIPAGITGMSAYDAIYADAIAWLDAGVIDYIAPQLYWQIGGSQDYVALSNWWDDQAGLRGRVHYPGLGLYRLNDSGWAASEIQNQINYNRDANHQNTKGQIFFTMNDLLGDDKGIKTALQANQYKYPSIVPALSWKDQICPNMPTNVAFANNTLTWTAPVAAADGETAAVYAVYRFANTTEINSNRHDGTKVIAVQKGTSLTITSSMLSGLDNYFVVSALDKNNNESIFSDPVYVAGTPSYCTSKGNSVQYEWIASVKVGATTYTSAANAGYADFTNKSFSVTAGSSYSMTLTPGYASTAYNEYWRVWIDANKDGDFDDAGEFVYDGASATANAKNATLTIPAGASGGNTRMRVSMNGTSANYSATPCTTFNFGEVEDYTLNITVPTPVAPVANNDAAATSAGLAVQVSVLANDTDTNNDINGATVVVTAAPANGTTSVSASGVITYTPNAGFSGTNTFTYTVKDNSNLTSNAATVTITVSAAPVCTSSLASVTVDFGSSDYSTTGTWVASTSSPGYKGTNYYHDNNTGKGTSTVNFSPAITGVYDVYVWFVAGTNRPTNAKYRINHDGGTKDVLVNQQINNATWVSLGRYQFTAGTANKVQLRTEGTDGFFVIADAVKFDFVACPGACITPSVTEKIVDNANATYVGTWTTGANAGYYGSNYLHDGGAGQGTKTATFTPNLEQDGSYELYTWYVEGTNRATNAKVEVTTLNGVVSSTTINQQTGGSIWKLVGTYDFAKSGATNAAKVVLKNDAANGVVIADAFRWVYKGCAVGAARSEQTTLGAVQNLSVKEFGLNVYPNPSNGIFNVEASFAKAQNIQLSVYDLLGKTIISESVHVQEGAFRTTLKADNWNEGVYVVKLQLENGESHFVKLIKQ